MKKSTLLFPFLFFCFASLKSQLDIPVHFQSGTVRIPRGSYTGIPVESEPARAFHALMVFDGLPSAQAKSELKNAGWTFHDFIPPSSWMVSLDEAHFGSRFGVRNTAAVSVWPVFPEWKISKGIASGNWPSHAMRDGKFGISVVAHSDVSPESVVAALASAGVSEISPSLWKGNWDVWVDADQIRHIAIMEEVKFIEPVPPPSLKENYTGRMLHRSNVINAEYPGSRRYNGDSVIVAMGDDGFIGPHIDYTGRIDQSRATASTGNHGDHVAGTITGAGNLDPRTKGMAPGATLFVYDVWDAVQSSSNDHRQYGVMITSTSYSNGCNAGYTSWAVDADRSSHQNPELLHIFSSGNDGASDCGYGAGAGWGNVTGGIKVAKNVIAVGNLDARDGLDASSSRGPAADGRIKPEVCAKGQDVRSTIDPNTYITYTGTSMACPGVSGTTAQLYHAHRRIFGGADPQSCLMRALLMNCAEDLGNPGPDFKHGYGRINALRSVRTMEEGRFLYDSVANGNTKNHTINVPPGTAEVRIMIDWTDPEGSALSSRPLVNDLDMVVTAPGAVQYLPWVLDPTPTPSTLNANAVRARDSINPMEQVTLVAPVAGSYSVSVTGTAVPQGPQTYVLVYEFRDSGVVVTHPTGGEHWVPGENERIYWDATGSWGTFTVEYSSDSGVTWNTLSASVAGSARHYDFVVPSIVSGNMLVRVSRGGYSDVSDADFSVIRVPGNLEVTAACRNYCILSWSSVTGAVAYEVSMLGNKYMDSIGTTTNTTFRVNGVGENQTAWFSVRAIGPDGASGRRAVAVYKGTGMFNCPEPDDVSVSGVLAPGDEVGLTCVGLDSLHVKIELKNYSPNVMTNIPVAFRLGNNPVITDVFTGSLPGYGTATHTFVGSVVDLSAPGTYNFRVWTDFPSDSNSFNDTLNYSTRTLTSSAATLPWSENFDSFTNCGTSANCGSTVCTLGNNLINPSISIDDMDWRVLSGSTPTQQTGPDNDHTTGSGKYVYLESSNCNSKRGYLLTPCFDLSTIQAPVFLFWHHMFGADMGELHVDLNVEGEWIRDVISPMTGNWFNSWWRQRIDLAQWSTKKVFIRFRGITGANESDIALDDLGLVDGTIGNDPGITSMDLQVYPNPSDGVFQVSGSGMPGEDVSVTVTDLSGKVLYSVHAQSQGDFFAARCDLSSLSSGLYLLRAGASRPVRIVLQHGAR